jgi:transcriptional regulator with XRE-family HTH domain
MLNELIKEKRIAKGLSQQDLAKKIDVTQATISEVETGAQKEILVRTAWKWCRFLRFPLDWFAKENKE